MLLIILMVTEWWQIFSFMKKKYKESAEYYEKAIGILKHGKQSYTEYKDIKVLNNVLSEIIEKNLIQAYRLSGNNEKQ